MVLFYLSWRHVHAFFCLSTVLTYISPRLYFLFYRYLRSIRFQIGVQIANSPVLSHVQKIEPVCYVRFQYSDLLELSKSSYLVLAAVGIVLQL